MSDKKLVVPAFDKQMAEILKNLPPGSVLHIPKKGSPYLREK
jgi:hypothetical protein